MQLTVMLSGPSSALLSVHSRGGCDARRDNLMKFITKLRHLFPEILRFHPINEPQERTRVRTAA